MHAARALRHREAPPSTPLPHPPTTTPFPIDGGDRHVTPSLAAALAIQYSEEIEVMRKMLDDDGVQLPCSHSHPAQLMRFAAASGLLKVPSCT
jgi:hypothetical protein